MGSYGLPEKEKYCINLLALGDVGGTLLLGLRLMGGDILSSIGIYDVRPGFVERYEQECNQIALPFSENSFPEVIAIEEEELFQCDLFVFCASGAVPEIGTDVQDVRMAQLAKNTDIIKRYAYIARETRFGGIFAVVSDPVDLLCQCVYHESNKNSAGKKDGRGLRPEQVRGYGLGVMHARAKYFAKRDMRFASYLRDGRAFGPHGRSLIIANSISDYDEELSIELTKLTVEANMRVRKTGFKPYIAPAISSGALSLLLTLRGDWHYSAVYQNKIYFGCKNRLRVNGTELENIPLPPLLRSRIDAVQSELFQEGARWR